MTGAHLDKKALLIPRNSNHKNCKINYVDFYKTMMWIFTKLWCERIENQRKKKENLAKNSTYNNAGKKKNSDTSGSKSVRENDN